ncbi:hypothetical protein BO94DRAFT_538902 [Aspergillus sclerotioniger CBS 115572]|uniref:CUE domain-containing protein n=1 Tax=Aspergillus sclerotioniger CBS 115572 TaxID=1450535 RepID=A0A317VLV5_9EURO|nr:hypothetical protein BO94DRAFT_538902 [Aspergillus sclerotioniger CBS 115572]PWY73852.1 hypothetical protein BO94DRAFT_538902 [Aspergillus sclerotioniger CBS 115572]
MPELPPLAPVPPPEVQSTVLPAEWELYIDAWILLLGVRIEAPDSQFMQYASGDESAVAFLASFYLQSAKSGSSGVHAGPKARTLRKLCFLLTRRFLLEASPAPLELLEWNVLANMCCCYPSSSALKRLLSDAWNKHQDAITASLEKTKAKIIRELTLLHPSKSTAVLSDVRLLTILASALPGCGQVLMAGSDFLDTFSDAYQAHKREDFRSVLVANVYVGLASLLKGAKPNLSSLLDQLFSLKSSAGIGTSTTKKEPTLLSDVICSTDLLVRLDRYLSAHPQKRGQDLVSSLRTYQEESKLFHRRHQKQKRRVDKGKGRATDLPPAEDLHIHRMSLITQVQDLFPDLGSAYITPLTDPHSLHLGRANADLTADAVLADRTNHTANKAAIMSALAAFDSDEDERDDTYDIADVGGTIDATDDTDPRTSSTTTDPNETEMTLYRAYKYNPALFARDSTTRRSQPRASLKRETGMTDEAIEGWAVMLTRDPKRLSKLEDKMSLSAGGPDGTLNQQDLPPTAYRKPGPDDSQSDTEDQHPSSRGRGGGRGRGRGGRRGGGGGRGGGNPSAGSSGHQQNGNPAVARQRKEENKASRANHNRRQQRAKKVARAGACTGFTISHEKVGDSRA